MHLLMWVGRRQVTASATDTPHCTCCHTEACGKHLLLTRNDDERTAPGGRNIPDPPHHRTNAHRHYEAVCVHTRVHTCVNTQ